MRMHSHPLTPSFGPNPALRVCFCISHLRGLEIIGFREYCKAFKTQTLFAAGTTSNARAKVKTTIDTAGTKIDLDSRIPAQQTLNEVRAISRQPRHIRDKRMRFKG